MGRFYPPFPGKKMFKLGAGACKICGDSNYDVLDVHRIKHGEDGGKYSYANCVCLCVRCHRLHHKGIIRVVGWFNSTSGRLLNYFDENGEEHFT